MNHNSSSKLHHPSGFLTHPISPSTLKREILSKWKKNMNPEPPRTSNSNSLSSAASADSIDASLTPSSTAPMMSIEVESPEEELAKDSVTKFTYSSHAYNIARSRSRPSQSQEQLPTASHSVEVFFGDHSSFDELYKSICDNGVLTNSNDNSTSEDTNGNVSTTGTETTVVTPDSIRKLVLCGHPMTSFEGIGEFHKVAEVYVTNCDIKEVKWEDLSGLEESVQRLYLYNCGLEKIEPFKFQAIKIIWLAGNKLTSLSFLGQGLPTLQELNVAQNEITYLYQEHIQQCVNLYTLNLAGNPICTQSDITALKTLTNLTNLYFTDPLYGKCPVACLCDARSMILNLLGHTVSSLDGKLVTANELINIQNYLFTRGLFYLSLCTKIGSEIVNKRTTTITVTNTKLEKIGLRVLHLTSLEAKFKRTIPTLDALPLFTNAKTLLKEHISKIQARILALNDSAKLTLKRLETIMHISQWEEQVEKWLKWIEFQTFGNAQCHLAHSVHTSSPWGNVDELCGVMHQLLSSLSCAPLWPKESLVKVETVVVLQDKGLDCTLKRTYDKHFQPNNEPKYIPPEIDYQLEKPIPPAKTSLPYYTFPAYQSHRSIGTYTDPDYEPPPPLRQFPVSVAGLPEQSQPLYMLLICPTGENCLEFVQRVIITDRGKHYQELRFTNCLWLANHNKSQTFSIVVIVKCLAECLKPEPVPFDRNACTHAWDCCCYSLKQGHSFSLAYFLAISFTPVPKSSLKNELPEVDEELVNSAESALETLSTRISTSRDATLALSTYSSTYMYRRLSYLQKTGTGLHAELSALHISHSMTRLMEKNLPNSLAADSFMSPNGFEANIARFIGSDIARLLTSLNLVGNKIGMTVGLRGLNSLKKLNLSHNNLTTLSGLERLPNLIELKVGWNSLRFLLSNSATLSWATPRLLTLEILPNPFQDIRDINHVPLILSRALPVVHRVDLWTSPLINKSPIKVMNPPEGTADEFTVVALSKSWGAPIYCYSSLAGKALTDLAAQLPPIPPFPIGTADAGMDLNLSNNYLMSNALATAAFLLSTEWNNCIVKLQLQDNLLTSLDWIRDHVLPNLQILDLSNNLLRDVEYLTTETCPNLAHLYLSSNNLHSDLNALNGLRHFQFLKTLDCSGNALSTHPDYSSFVLTSLTTVEILDGIPMSEWEFSNSINRTGGILTQDWLDTKLKTLSCTNGIGTCDLNKLSMSNCCLQKLALSSNSLSKLSSLNLQNNSLSTLSNVSSFANLRVVCLSHNNVSQLGGSPCPTCYSNTAQSQAANKLRQAKVQENCQSFQVPLTPRKKQSSKSPFPKLEVVILSHNGLTGMKDLHLHAMPYLSSAMLCCNNLTTVRGLENIPTLKALVLDNNHIRDLPQHSLLGCKSLKYLHLEHNRLSALPRLAHLTNLTGLYLAHNKIQSLTDLECFTNESEITESTLKGNLVSTRSDLRLTVAARLPKLNTIDGKDLSPEKTKLEELTKKLFPLMKPTAVKPHRSKSTNASNSIETVDIPELILQSTASKGGPGPSLRVSILQDTLRRHASSSSTKASSVKTVFKSKYF